MEKNIKTIETLAAFKKLLKKFVRATIKLPADLFRPEDPDLIVFKFVKEDIGKYITVCIENDYTLIEIKFEAPTRLYNKVDYELVDEIVQKIVSTKKNVKAVVKY